MIPPLINVCLSALLAYLSFPNIILSDGIPYLLWICLVPLLAALTHVSTGWRLLYGFVFGVMLFGSLVHWLIPVHPAGYLVFVLALSVQMVVWAAFVNPSRLKALGWFVPCLWVATEYLRTVVFQGFTWSLGYGLSGQPMLIQSASLGGVWMVTFCVVWVNTLVYLAILRRSARYLGASAIVISGLIMFGFFRVADKPADIARLHVAVVQAQVRHEDKMDPQQYDQNILEYWNLTNEALNRYPLDVVLWPETAFSDDVLTDELWRPQLERTARMYGVYLITGSARLIDGKDYNSAVLFSPWNEEGDAVRQYHKMHLVPGYEFDPWPAAGLLSTRYNFRSGEKTGVFELRPTHFSGGVSAGVAICSETAYAALFRDIVRQGADVLFVLLNNGWTDSVLASRMHRQMSVFRAVETGRPLVQSGNTGWSGAISRTGIVQASALSEAEKGYAVFLNETSRERTSYVQLGDFFPIGCMVFVIMGLIMCIPRISSRALLLCGVLTVMVPDVWAGGQVQRIQQQRAMQQQIMQRQVMQQRQQAMQQQVAAQRAAMQQAVMQKARQQAYNQAMVQRQQMIAQAVARRRAVEMAQYAQVKQVKEVVAARRQQVVNQQVAEYVDHVKHQRAAQAVAMQQAVAQKQIIDYRAAQDAQSAAQQAARALNNQPAADVVDITQLWSALDDDASAWALIMDPEIKSMTVAEYIDRFRSQGVVIKQPPHHYAEMIDSMSMQNPSMLSNAFANVLSIVAILEYDFDNGRDKDQLAREVLGTEGYERNKARLKR